MLQGTHPQKSNIRSARQKARETRGSIPGSLAHSIGPFQNPSSAHGLGILAPYPHESASLSNTRRENHGKPRIAFVAPALPKQRGNILKQHMETFHQERNLSHPLTCLAFCGVRVYARAKYPSSGPPWGAARPMLPPGSPPSSATLHDVSSNGLAHGSSVSASIREP